MRKEDTIILGSGVSGCYASILLAQTGQHVTLLSSKLKTEYHLPESWVFHPSKQLQEIGIVDDLSACISKESQSTFWSPDGKRSVTINTSELSDDLSLGDVVRVNRNAFDQVFLKKAQLAGVKLIEVEELCGCTIFSSHLEVVYKYRGANRSLMANHIIDATGKRAYLSDCLSLPTLEIPLKDQRYACFSHFEGTNTDIKGLQIVALNGGYLFCIPIHSTRLSLGCVMAQSCFDSPPDFERMLNAAIESSPFIKKIIKHFKRVLPVIPIKNFQKFCKQPAGIRYRLVGDAAAFMDPFFCPGIDFALDSAEQAVSSLIDGTKEKYTQFVNEWLIENQKSLYSKLELSKWNEILRTFADPHLPYLIPITLTQAFCRLGNESSSFKKGIDLARKSYESAVY